MEPRIAIDYTAAVHQQAGIGRSVRELTAALIAFRRVVDWRLFIQGQADMPAYIDGATVHTSPLSERNHVRMWHKLRLPIPVDLWTGDIDLFHGPDFLLPATRPSTKTVVTINDLAYERFPDETMPNMQQFLSKAVPRSVDKADLVLVPSQATRTDLMELYDTPREKIELVHHGVDPRFRADREQAAIDVVRQRYNLPDGPLVLTVGTLQPRKNHARLVRAMARLAHDAAALVIVGGRGWAYEQVHQTVEDEGLSDRVHFPGFVDDADLPVMYNAATVFAYPALYEGFGLPILEALASGTPVLTSETSSMPEVAGDAALLVDPFDVDSIAAAIDSLLDDPDQRQTLIEAGLHRAENFTWQRAAEETWTAYQKALTL